MFETFVESLRAYSQRLRPPQAHRAAPPTPVSGRPAASAPSLVSPALTAHPPADELRQARMLLQQASHLARYHQPALEADIRRFLAETRPLAEPRGDARNEA